jgi:hypothetical protein
MAIGFGWSQLAQAGAGHGHHGAAKISVSIESAKVSVELEMSSEDAYGTEKAPSTPEEKQKAQEAVDKVSKNAASMILFDSKLGCEWTQKSIEPWKAHEGDTKGGHGELHAEWDVMCKTKVDGSRLKFGVKKIFPSVNTLEVKVKKDSKTGSHKINRDRGSVTL